MKNRSLFTLAALCLGILLAAGCSKQSYPGDRLKEALSEICQKEYGIDQIDVKIKGTTIGVFLPLDKLLAFDFREILEGGKVPNVERLFELSPEALDKIDNVLFSLSRVLLSTDRKLQFYVLQATDVERTGYQLRIAGYVDDIRRVRIWDISRGEYRKRMINEWEINRPVVWHRPVRNFFKDLETLPLDKIQERYFEPDVSTESIRRLFLNKLQDPSAGGIPVTWQLVELKSVAIQKDEVVVLAEVKPVLREQATPLPSPGERGEMLKYLFIINFTKGKPHLRRIIPFQYVNDEGALEEVTLPEEFGLEGDIPWEEEFMVEEMQVGPFLAEQLTRRGQALFYEDERIHNTFHKLELEFKYDDSLSPPFFSLDIEAVLRDFDFYTKDSIVFHEDMLYPLNIAFREFVDVLRSYRFGDYDYLRLNLEQEASPWIIGREDLELFRREKVDFQGLFTLH